MYGVTSAARRAATILQVDGDLQAKWREVLVNLTPLATSDDADALKPDSDTGRARSCADASPRSAGGSTPDGNSFRCGSSTCATAKS